MLADARAVLPTLLTRPAEPEQDHRTLKQLALWLGRYGPLRNIEQRDGLWVDITGVAHLFGGEEALAKDCIHRLKQAGFQALIAIADTRSGAYALARHGHVRDRIIIAPPGKIRQALAPLPVQGLQLTEDLVILLRRLGLRQIGQLYALPRAALARRFREAAPKISKGRKRRKDLVRASASAYTGWAEALVIRLDQALGDLSEPEPGIEEPPVYRAQRAYLEPLISNEGITAALEELAAHLCGQLEQQNEGARRLRFSIYRADGSTSATQIGTSRPARSPAHMIEIFQPRLEKMDAGLGLDAIVLEALATEQLNQEQVALSTSTPEQDPALLIDKLSNHLGPKSVFYLSPMQSHVPERAQRRVAALHRSCITQPLAASDDAATPHRPTALRPLFLLDPPELLTVIATVPDGPPVSFAWRRIRRRVIRATGPERIAPEWWQLIGRSTKQLAGAAEHHNRTRDYYQVEDEHGGLYWIYRAGLYPTGSPLQDSTKENEPSSTDPSPSTSAISGITAAQPPTWYLHGLF